MSSEPSMMDKVKKALTECWASTVSSGKNTKEMALIKQCEFKIESRKKKFGVDYLNLRASQATPEALQKCLESAESDIKKIMDEIHQHENTIDANREELNRKLGKPSGPGDSGTGGAKGEERPLTPNPIPTTTPTPNTAATTATTIATGTSSEGAAGSSTTTITTPSTSSPTNTTTTTVASTVAVPAPAVAAPTPAPTPAASTAAPFASMDTAPAPAAASVPATTTTATTTGVEVEPTPPQIS